MDTSPESLSLFPDLISSEGTAYKLKARGNPPRPEVELVVIRLIFGNEDSAIKTFWWVARDELSKEEIAAGRLMATNMREAISAARFATKKRFRISRTREETRLEPELTLEDWGHRHMDWLKHYAVRDPVEETEPGIYHQPTLF